MSVGSGRLVGLIFFVLSQIFFPACARLRYEEPENVQTGNASWYGPDFHGKLTSSREVYDMYDMTAAHPTLPLDTSVVVTNLKNGKSVTVRINDRGPFVRGRIIDLSYAAAEVIGAVGSGVIPVRLEVLGRISSSSRLPKYAVQAGAFVSRDNAEKLWKRLQADFRNVHIQEFATADHTYYRVRIKAENRAEAEGIALKLTRNGLVSFIVEE